VDPQSTPMSTLFPHIPTPSFFVLSFSTTAKVVDNVARLYQHGELAAEDEEGWEPCEVLLIGAFLDFTPLSSLFWYLPIVFLCKSPAIFMHCMQCGRSSMVLLEPLVMHALTLSFSPRFPPRFPPRLDDHLASVYARSPRVKKEFTDYHDNLRIAIGMARQMQVRIPAPPFPSYLSPFTCLSPFFYPLQDPLALVTLIYAAQDPRGGRFGGPGYQLSYLSLHDLQVSTFPSSISSLLSYLFQIFLLSGRLPRYIQCEPCMLRAPGWTSKSVGAE